jgi:hypothetical protein
MYCPDSNCRRYGMPKSSASHMAVCERGEGCVRQQPWKHLKSPHTDVGQVFPPVEHIFSRKCCSNISEVFTYMLMRLQGLNMMCMEGGGEGLVNGTKYVHIKSTTVYAPRRNWDSPPTPHPQASAPPSPLFLGGGEHSLARKGLGESQFRRGAYTVVLFICTYFVVNGNVWIWDHRP